ncbi:cell surface A33 antigen-like [Parambassis ranga]|uniref:Cell surface A33 antigen-like n=1 Tax=Parambassis ranga TaxID=210632 RepID=A0A6P7IDX5_9TELE|nr:cell surface A33 antigen-like [Parambassis ranga]
MEGRILAFILLCLVPHVGAITVEIPKPKPYESARGGNVTLPCTFIPSKPNPATVTISWSVRGLEPESEEDQFLTYYYPDASIDTTSTYGGRVAVDVDVPKGKANLMISALTLNENKIFKCAVQIRGDVNGKTSDTTRLVVLVAPSTPICNIQGTAEYGQNINLTCKSEEGSPSPTYKWESRDVQNMPRVPDPKTTDKDGILSLYNISKDTSGYFICTSANKIRSATCNITLSVMPPSMNVASTAGIIAGVVIALIILFIVIYCCCCRKKKNEEEYAMGVHEEFHDKEPEKTSGGQRSNGAAGDRSDQHEVKSERDHDNRRGYDDPHSDYDDRRSDYDDRRRDHDGRRRDHDDQRRDYDDRRSDYDDRRSDYSDRRSDYDDRRSDYNDRRDRYDDRRDRYDDDRRHDRDEDRPPVPANKPPRRD